MSKSTAALIFMLVSSLFVFPAQAQERDDSRLTPAQRNRTGTLRELIPVIMSSRPPVLTAASSQLMKESSSSTRSLRKPSRGKNAK